MRTDRTAQGGYFKKEANNKRAVRTSGFLDENMISYFQVKNALCSVFYASGEKLASELATLAISGLGTFMCTFYSFFVFSGYMYLSRRHAEFTLVSS